MMLYGHVRKVSELLKLDKATWDNPWLTGATIFAVSLSRSVSRSLSHLGLVYYSNLHTFITLPPDVRRHLQYRHVT